MPDPQPRLPVSTNAASSRPRPSLSDVWKVSLWLGCSGFGGGLSVLALIRSQVVIRRGWMTEREFSNTVTVSQMLPGGASANALAYMGLRFRGIRGALAGYIGFVLPGCLAVLASAWAYVRFGATPNVDLVLSGFNAAVVGIIFAITLKMVASSIARLWQMGIAATSLLLSFAGNAPPAEVVVFGVVIGLGIDFVDRRRVLARRGGRRPKPPVALPDEGTLLQRTVARVFHKGTAPPESGEGRNLKTPVLIALLAIAHVALGPSLRDHLRAYFSFFRTGLGAYGGGFAIIPHLKQVMAQSGWLTDKQFADAVAIGKLTPGPVLLLATFIGYVHEGLLGGLLATLAIFAGPFGLVVVFGAWLDRVRSRRWVRASLRGLTPAVVGLMAAAALTLGAGFGSNIEVGIAAATALTMTRFEMNPVLVLLVGGAARIALAAAGVRG